MYLVFYNYSNAGPECQAKCYCAVGLSFSGLKEKKNILKSGKTCTKANKRYRAISKHSTEPLFCRTADYTMVNIFKLVKRHLI